MQVPTLLFDHSKLHSDINQILWALVLNAEKYYK